MSKTAINHPITLGGAEDVQHVLKILERANRIASTSELDELLQGMLDLIIEVCRANMGILYLVDRTAGELIFKVIKGDPNIRFDYQKLVGKRISLETGIAGETLKERHPVQINEDVTHDPRWYPGLAELFPDEIHNALSLPLQVKREPIGVIQIFNYTYSQLELVHLLSDRMASEIDKAMLLQESRLRSSRLETLIANMGQIGSTLDRDQILRLIINYAREMLNAEACSLFLVDEGSGDLVLTVASNINANVSVERIHVPAGKGIIGHVIRHGETILVPDVKRDKRHYTKVDQRSGFITRSILSVPLVTRTVVLGGERGTSKERIIGGLEAMNKMDGTFTEDDAQLLRSFTTQAATVLEVASLYANANELFLDVIKALTAAIDAKDPYTEGHSQRVCEYSVEIARQIGLPPERIHYIRIGSLFHDVGKIGVPDIVLGKAGQLTAYEYSQIKQHPTIGARIMSQVRMMTPEIPALAQHHERLDGSGYPNGLRDNQISLAGQIVAVADVFDAMTSDRPYRRGMPVEEVFNYMQERTGTYFDKACVEALITAYKNGQIQTQKEREKRIDHSILQ